MDLVISRNVKRWLTTRVVNVKLTDMDQLVNNLKYFRPTPNHWSDWVTFGLQYAVLEKPWVGLGMAPGTPPSTSRAVIPLKLYAYREPMPGARWQALLAATWSGYRDWYLRDGAESRPTLAECRSALQHHMPELLPIWEKLTALAAQTTGDGELAGRLLSLWCPPAFVAQCSQVALSGSEPALIRNYDYSIALFESVIASTNYSGERKVIGTSDCLWGLVDGMNEDGLAISLTVGGRPDHDQGFAIPIVLRWLLETCSTVETAITRLAGLPIAQAYNLTLIDRTGQHATVFVAPGEAPIISDLRVATNHCLTVVEYPQRAARFRSRERQDHLLQVLDHAPAANEVVDAMLEAPLRATEYDAGFGTLYTADYRPAAGTVTYFWPGRSWTRQFDDPDDVFEVEIPQ